MSLLNLQETLALNLTAAFSFTAETELTPEFRLKDGQNLRVVVSHPRIESAERLTRGGAWDDVLVVDVAVVQRVQPNAGVPVLEDAILDIANDIREHIKTLSVITGDANYALIGVIFDPFYDYEDLDESHQVISIITTRFKEITG